MAEAPANNDKFNGKDAVGMDSLHNSESAVTASTLDRPGDNVTELITAEADVDDSKE